MRTQQRKRIYRSWFQELRRTSLESETRYTGAVTVTQVRDFRGAMMGLADKGIILTTGSFTADSRKEAIRDGVPPIELVDGEKLIGMLEKLELGLKPRITYEVDNEFFISFE